MNNTAEASHCHGGVRRADGPRYSGSVSISGMCFHSELVGTWKPAEYTGNLAVLFSKLCLCGPCNPGAMSSASHDSRLTTPLLPTVFYHMYVFK